MRHTKYVFVLASLLSFAVHSAEAEPLAIGDTFTLNSEVLDETRRINVFTPTRWGEPITGSLPVLYMPDGGINEDFLHIAGLIQISVSNGTMRPFLLVGIENTERARDLTGPSVDPRDKEMAPRVGKSDAFRRFLREELFPEIKRRYPITAERAIVGESLAGLFVVETLLLAPKMFDTYIAFDPSLWWNFQALPNQAAERLARKSGHKARLLIATGEEAGGSEPIRDFVSVLRQRERENLQWHYQAMPSETHATLYHPAALKAFRRLFGVEAR